MAKGDGGYRVRGNKIYVFGTVDGEYYRIATGKTATPLNIKWVSKNHRDILIKLVNEKNSKDDSLNKSDEITLVEYGWRSLKFNEPTRKVSSIKDFNSIFKKHIIPYFEKYTLEQIRPMDIKEFQAYLLTKGLTAKTVKNIRVVLGTILSDAKRDELIDKNPIELVKSPKITKVANIEPFSKEEVKTLIESSEGWFKHFLIVGFFTGIRTGEALILQWNDIDFENNRISIERSMRQGIISTPKSGKGRLIDMLPIVKKSLIDHREHCNSDIYVFSHSRKKPYTESSTIIKRFWKPLLKRCKMKYQKLYNTRHSFATIMLIGGEDIVWVSRMLGHSDVTTTMKYYIKYIGGNNQNRAAFLDGFDTITTQKK